MVSTFSARDVPDILAGGQEEGTDAEVGLAILIDGLAGDGTLADRLDVAHLARLLQGRLRQVFPGTGDDGSELPLRQVSVDH